MPNTDESHTQGLSDAKIQLISGHESRASLEVYQHLSLEAVEADYPKAVRNLEIWAVFATEPSRHTC